MAVSHGAAQKQQEQQCLQIALDARKYQKGESRRILDLLAGQDVPRKTDERPDFVRRTLPKTKQDKGVLLGIEHFRVDHWASKVVNKRGEENGKVAGKGVPFAKEQKQAYEKWEDNPHASNLEAADQVLKLRAKAMTYSSLSNYRTLLESFETVLKKHLESVPEYYKCLNQLANKDEQVYLALLIEMHEEFGSLILKNQRGYKPSFRSHPPIFAGIIRILKANIDPNEVQYIVLCLSSTDFNAPVNTIVINTNDIEKSLKKQHVHVYEYVASDVMFPPFAGQLMQAEYECNVLGQSQVPGAVDTEISVKPSFVCEELIFDVKFYSAQCILYCEQKNIEYAAGPLDVIFAKALEPEVLGWIPRRDAEEWQVRPIFHDSNIERAIERVETRQNSMEEKFDSYETALNEKIERKRMNTNEGSNR